MKKLSYLFLLLVGIWLAGCDDSSEASLIPEIIPTEQGSDTYVMKGYESSDNGFNVYNPRLSAPLSISSPKLLPGVITHLLLLIVSRWKGLLLFRLPMLSAKALR